MSLRLILATFAVVLAAQAATPLDEAISLYKERKYPAARAAFEQIATADPANAAACYYLGMTLLRRGDGKAQEDALPWLEKAAKLEPNNATYLSDYGGISMLVASKTLSFGAATRGRDAMEKSLSLNPKNIEARIGLWRFYSEAPWPLKDRTKATAQLAEIRTRDPKRAALLLIDLYTRAKNFGEAFKVCDELLAKSPDDFFALLQYARVCVASGQNLERGLAGLKKQIALGSAATDAANLASAWVRAGNIHEKLGQVAEARNAYETALKLQPNERNAAAALANLK